MPTRAKSPIEVRETPTSDSQNDNVPKVRASGSPLENPISRIAISRGSR
jgi:hypothetical protein